MNDQDDIQPRGQGELAVGPQAAWRGWLALASCGLVLAGVWLIVLPWLSTLPPFAQHIRLMEERDIVVDALFYTELNWQPPDGAAWR